MLNNNFNQNSFPMFQNFGLQKTNPQQDNQQDRKVFERFLAKDNKVTPDTPRGHLIKETLSEEFVSTLKDNAKDVKNLGVALKDGKGTDTQLGRLNDLGMKIGGGVIAGALMGHRATTNKKLMEGIGFATFFSMMSLWPKVAIDAPTKLLRGFNPHQKYQDSNGDKKPFFLDNQYLSWDMWSKDEIEKIGDKMNVPKDIKDRDEYTKEKMRTIALQDNTLWMATAGLATPLLTSLACNRIEEGMRIPLAHQGLRGLASQAQPENTEKLVQEALNSSVFEANDKKFAGIIQSLRNGVEPKNFTEDMRFLFNITHPDIAPSVVSSKYTETSTEMIDEIISNARKGKELDFTQLARTIAKGESDANIAKIAGIIEDSYKEAQAALKGGAPDPKKVAGSAMREMGQQFKVNGQLPAWFPDSKGKKAFMETMEQGIQTSSLSKKGYAEMADQLEQAYKGVIRPAQARMSVYGNQTVQLNNIAGEKYNLFAREVLRCFDFSDDEITKLNQLQTTEEKIGMVTERAAKIARGEGKKPLSEVLSSLTAVRDKVESTSSSIIPGRGEKVTIAGVFDAMTDNASKGLQTIGKTLGMDGQSIITPETKLGRFLSQGVTDADKGQVRQAVSSIEAMVSRTFAMFELESRIADGSLLSDYQENCRKRGIPSVVLQEGVERDGVVATKEAAETSLQKFYHDCRFVTAGSSYSDVMNKYHGGGNKESYIAFLDAVFADSSNPDISQLNRRTKVIAAITNFDPNDALKINYFDEAKKAVKNAGGDEKDDKQVLTKVKELFGLTSSDFQQGAKSSSTQFAELGEATVETIKKQADQLANDRKWMKFFGGATAVLVGATLISQLFFGKVKDADKYQRISQQDTFVSGKNGK